jgi:hypothetical protein
MRTKRTVAALGVRLKVVHLDVTKKREEPIMVFKLFCFVFAF